MGCHAGLNVPDAFLPAGRAAPDWAQTFAAAKGASVYLANTGFGYGDSDTVAYSEDLNARFAANLADGMTAGAAFARGKGGLPGRPRPRRRLRREGDGGADALRPADGLDRRSASGCRRRSAASPSSPRGAETVSAAVSTRGAARDDGQRSGGRARLRGVLRRRLRAARPRRRRPTARGNYFHGRDGELVTHLRPIEPKATQKIETPNAHGALITALTSQDVTSPPFDPLFARPTVDSTATRAGDRATTTSHSRRSFRR